MSGFYAVYHGPDGLKEIGHRVNTLTKTLATGLKEAGYSLNLVHFLTLLLWRHRMPKTCMSKQIA